MGLFFNRISFLSVLLPSKRDRLTANHPGSVRGLWTTLQLKNKRWRVGGHRAKVHAMKFFFFISSSIWSCWNVIPNVSRKQAITLVILHNEQVNISYHREPLKPKKRSQKKFDQKKKKKKPNEYKRSDWADIKYRQKTGCMYTNISQVSVGHYNWSNFRFIRILRRAIWVFVQGLASANVF